MLEDKKTKVKITFLVILVGISSMLAAVVTDHWAVLSPRVEQLNTTCEAAHFGLWRLCKKSIFIVEEDPQGKGCGPISLPGGKEVRIYCKLFLMNPISTRPIDVAWRHGSVFHIKFLEEHLIHLKFCKWKLRSRRSQAYYYLTSSARKFKVKSIFFCLRALQLKINPQYGWESILQFKGIF